MNKTRILISGGAILVLIFVALLVMHSKIVAPAAIPMTTATQTASTTTVNLGNGMIATLPAGVHISSTTPASTQAPSSPNLNHSVSFSSTLSPDVVAALKTQVAMYTTQLKKDPSNGQAWLKLAVDYKIAGDFPAAQSVWIYMTKVAPTSPVAFQDLGDLYQNFLKDNPKAETNYLTAVKLAPQNIDLYRDLYTLYKYQYKTNTTAAADIVTQGLKANPNNPDLLALQKQ